MKNHYRKTLPLIILLAGLVGCTASNETVIDDITAKADSQQAGQTASAVGADGQPIQEVVVPQDNAITEDTTDASTASAKAGDSSADAQTAGQDKTGQSGEAASQKTLYTIHFDFDRYTINETERGLLAKNAAWLNSTPRITVRIEGHADERGETEYNLALGDRRASAVKKFLQDLGISPGRLSTISYGEEKPAAQGHNEEAWAQNRRAEFDVLN
ncbi:MAG: peptidoglycan-associated lipoprotein Pal [Deltaproteobacteria bacterium]|nr:peptidoglycan-associated lipoprotein Pal [Deltaproteobacteria bacterium]